MKVSWKVNGDINKLPKQLAQLSELDPEELRKTWLSSFGSNPPPRLRPSLMIRAIAYRLQEKAFGGIRPETRRLLEKVAQDAIAGHPGSTTAGKIRLQPGSMLVREWHGSKHQVSVLKDGFLYRSKRYCSLSEIARSITGTRWSGPLFFGLKSSRTERTHGAA
jgi:Protein of unknown function (DUF2924)